MKESLPCKVNIGRVFSPEGGTDCDSIMRIEVTDDVSGVRVIRFEMSPEEFMLALTGMGYRPGVMEVTDHFYLIGCKQEVEHWEVVVPDGPFQQRDDRATSAVRALEKDGWVGNVKDALNHHRLVSKPNLDVAPGEQVYRVAYHRHVDKDGKPVSASG